MNDPRKSHICQNAFNGVGDMRGAYERLGTLATSENGDIFLIRSHVAYWSGNKRAKYATIKPSRGHSYRVTELAGFGTRIVRIVNYYDHREGVQGWK